MPAKLSVIIPTLNAVERLAPCLAALQAGVTNGVVHELIFADGGSDDSIEKLAQELGAHIVHSRTGRGTQLAAGVAASKGEWIMIIHADSVLDAHWPSVISAHIANSKNAGYGKLRYDCNGIGAKIVSAWANLRAQWFNLPYGDQMLILPRALYDQTGGYPDIPLMEDVALVRSLHGRIQALDITVSTGADRYIRNGWLAQGTRNLWILLRYLMGADPSKLAKIYHRQK